MFENLRIHQKSINFARKAFLLPLRQAKLFEDFIAACILMGMRRSKLETDIDDAKRSRLRWIKICYKVAPSLLALAGQSANQWKRTNSNIETNAGAAGSMVVEIHQCDKCEKKF
ncbi:hypothetical protein IEQ34_004803 [Dendrobium chrysotoxum]|uniref:Uncharacterized protein n=1 Tax=Dendrobium chrysotoxum TaxID=161865 RepID=A0AAV7GS65_DENCH|nr:hypothetical protein IEQ34_004803 [Dendrobium chrysotoxum]